MMKTRLAILAFALLPLAASAQMPLSRPIGPSAAAAGIGVTAQGAVRIQVKTVSFIALVRGPADESTALAAMRAAGIDDAVIGPTGSNVSFNGPGATTVRGTVRDVTPAKLQRIGEAAAGYMRAHPGTTIDNVNFLPRLDDCAAQEQRARTLALAEARRKAQAIAELSAVTIEGVQSVTEGGGCPGPSEAAYPNNGPFDISTLSSTITVYESVTFSIVQGSPSTRRRTL